MACGIWCSSGSEALNHVASNAMASLCFTPPTRNGVGPSCVALPPGTWPTLLDFLQERFPNVTRATWLQRMARGDVLHDTGQAVSPEQAGAAPYPVHQRLYYYRDVPNEPAIPFEAVVLHQDAHLIVVDKPHFLPVMPSGGYLNETVLVRLKRALDIDTLVPIHRIDRDTAGLVMFSIQPSSRAAYNRLFSQRQVHKTYQAIAPWRVDVVMPQTRQSRIRPAGHFMLQHEVPGPSNATTHMAVLEVRGSLARYQLKPVTGQRHQLRVHMMALGLPIQNDGLYPTLTPQGQLDHAKPLKLLAEQLAFIDPVSGQQRHFVSQRTLDW